MDAVLGDIAEIICSFCSGKNGYHRSGCPKLNHRQACFLHHR